MDLFSILLGVIIGAIGAYLANYYAVTDSEQKKTAEVTTKLHCLLIMEVSGHQIRLVRILEPLQSWLDKGDTPSNPKLKHEIYYLKLPVYYFRQFLGDLIHSPSLLGIANYYRNVDWLNQESKDLEREKDNDRLAYSYIRGCAQVLEASIDFMDELLESKDIERYGSGQVRAKIDVFKNSRAHYLDLAASIVKSRMYPSE